MSIKPPDPVFVLRGCNDAVSSLQFINPTSDNLTTHLIAGTQNGHALIWDLKTKGITHRWKAYDSSILWLKNHHVDKIWSQGRNDSIKLWDIGESSPRCISSYPSLDYMGFSQSDTIYLKDNVCLLAMPGPGQNNVAVFDVKTQKKICYLKTNDTSKEGNVMQVKWVEIGNRTFVFVAYESGSLILWDWSNNAVFNQINIGENPMCVDVHSETLQGLCGTASDKLIAFSISSSGNLSCNECIIITNSGIASCINRPDGKIFATGGWDHRIRLFSLKKRKPLAVLLYHKDTIQCMAYSINDVNSFPNGNILAAGSMDQSISLWSVYN